MYLLLAAMLLTGGAPAAPAASPCAAADLAISALRINTIAERGKPDHIIITGTVANVGSRDQSRDVKQNVVLLRNRIKVGEQPVPVLPARGATDIAFSIDRPHDQRKRPLPLGLQLVLGDAARNDCIRSNDLVEKTF